MIAKQLKLKNWRNFRDLDVALKQRTYLIGPNASGKSNLLDVFRFLRDIAKPGGGLQEAVNTRGGITKVRSLLARQGPVHVEIHLASVVDDDVEWRYELGFKGQGRGHNLIEVEYEKVWHKNKQILDRPDQDDKKDKVRLTQTFLEQINSNGGFRDTVKFFETITYLHLVPQLLKYSKQISGNRLQDDPFGQGFLERLAKHPEKTRNSKLKKIEKALQVAVPQLKELGFDRDDVGLPHLVARYEHWRPTGAIHNEMDFSDGTLRLVALVWSLLEGSALLLLEEPELSLNDGIVEQIPRILNQVQKKNKRQIIISTHSEALLKDKSIDISDVVVLKPSKDGTKLITPGETDLIQLRAGLSIADVLLPKTKPDLIDQLNLL